MARPSQGPVAVITGDVVDSSALPPEHRRGLLAVLKSLTATLRETLGPEAVPLPLDVYGGDGWQVLVTRPSLALRAALLVRATLRAEVDPASTHGVDTRVVVARGPVDFLSDDRVSESEGEAFRLSGRGLAALGDRRMAFANAGRSTLDDWDVVFHLLDVIARDWTGRQARAIHGALRGWRQDRIAELWTPRITQPTVAGHLRAARWEAVEAAVAAFESRLAALEEESV